MYTSMVRESCIYSCILRTIDRTANKRAVSAHKAENWRRKSADKVAGGLSPSSRQLASLCLPHCVAGCIMLASVRLYPFSCEYDNFRSSWICVYHLCTHDHMHILEIFFQFTISTILKNHHFTHTVS